MLSSVQIGSRYQIKDNMSLVWLSFFLAMTLFSAWIIVQLRWKLEARLSWSLSCKYY